MGSEHANDPEAAAPWPPLPLAGWRDTCETLQLWTQIVGKAKLAAAPPLNHWWQVTLRVTARGLTTGLVPHGDRGFEATFDLVAGELAVSTTEGRTRSIPLDPRPVAAFHADFLSALRDLDLDLHLWRMPVEIPDPVPFDEDRRHASYDAAAARRFLAALQRAQAALDAFAGRFQGKQSPVHFFWGSFDLASTRFSGRRAPARPGADRVTREAYSHEVMSFGFWPGTAGASDAAFYAYAAPEPDGFPLAPVPAGGYHAGLHEFLLPYEDARRAASPREAVLAFFQAAYDAGARLGRWDPELDRPWRPSAPPR